mgnify:CR=1 FL=1
MKVINQYVTDKFSAYHGDCVEVMKGIPDSSVHYSIFSPPFASLYTYSNSDRDMSNCIDDETFMKNMEFLAKELYRATVAGRLVSFHVMNTQATLGKDGFRGIIDLRGDLIRLFQNAGFIYHSEVTIWKDPELAAIRTKNPSLLYRNFKKDASKVRQGLAEYLITMRKEGEDEPVTHNEDEHPRKLWANYASPVWMDINPSDTLQRTSAKEEKDEKHLTPTNLEILGRAIDLWTNPNDIVLSPFMGIGSEGFKAIDMKRRFVGIELKESYYNVALNNLKAISTKQEQETLF